MRNLVAMSGFPGLKACVPPIADESLPMTGTAHRLLLALVVAGFCQGVCAAGDAHEWRALEKIGPQVLAPGLVWQAGLIEEDTPGKRSKARVGNTGTQENTNARKLVIEVSAEGGDKVLRHEEVLVPSETLRDDPCSVNRVEGFAAEGNVLSLTLVHEFACGAGSSVTTSYRLEIGRENTRIIEWQLSSASRDANWTANIEYPEGRMTVNDDSPDSDPDMPEKIHKITKVPPVLTEQSLMQCLPPLRGTDVMNCGQP